jgi:hypothetical protein
MGAKEEKDKIASEYALSHTDADIASTYTDVQDAFGKKAFCKLRRH